MPRTNRALSYLPRVKISSVLAAAYSPRALKAVLNKVAQMQNDVTPTGAYNAVRCLTDSPYSTSLWDISVTAPAFATGNLVITTAIAGNTVTINGLLYTAVAGVKTNNTEFSIDTGDNETALDLAASINADVRVGTFGDVSANPVLSAVVLTQTVIGIAGNATTLASTGGTIAISGATFTGGVDFEEYIITFNSEITSNITTINRPALSSRRKINAFWFNTVFFFTVRSAQVLLDFVLKLEDLVAISGNGDTANGNYFDCLVGGPTPYESYIWNISKFNDTYIITPTAGS